LLRKIKDGWDLQHLARPCWTCNGDGGMCKDCNGTGEFQEGLFYLQRYVLPDGTIERVPVAKEKVSGKPKNEIYGRVADLGKAAKKPEVKKFQLRDYQVENAAKGVEILREYKLLALMMECRVGKTLTALETLRLYGSKHVLFLTKKIAIKSIQADYALLNPAYELTVINHESMHKVTGNFDAVIVDECHVYSAYSKPSARYKAFKERFSHLPIILVSATFSAESYSQLFHIFTLSNHSPFKHKNFYAWAKEFVDIRQRVLPQGTINDYSRADISKIEPLIQPYVLTYTQEQAGFLVTLHEHFHSVEMPAICGTIADRLMATGVVVGKTGTISADNAAALKQKIHQLHAGTILLDEDESGVKQRVVISPAKAQYIQDTWPNTKIVIFYMFKAEWLAIKQVLGDRVTDDLIEFQSSDKSCAFQITRGSQGIDLSMGENIVFFNVSHSSLQYWQGRDRLTTKTRLESHINWLFSSFNGEPGIEKEIYSTVMDKKDFTTSHFKKLYRKRLNPKFTLK
jgi:hypothetical protein